MVYGGLALEEFRDNVSKSWMCLQRRGVGSEEGSA